MDELLADEDVPRPIVEKLRDKGFQVFYVEEEMKSSSDKEVIEKSRDLSLPILTFDNDFFDFSTHPGVFHVTQRTNYDQIVKSIDDVVTKVSLDESENSVIRINPSHYTS